MSESTNLREPHAQLVMAHGWLLRGRIWQPLQQQLGAAVVMLGA